MSEVGPVFPHDPTSKKKKRRRDEAQGGDERVGEEKKKKRRKHGEESLDSVPPVQPDIQTAEKKKKGKREKAAEADAFTIEANPGTEKKTKRKRDGNPDATPELNAEPGDEVREGKKKKKKKRRHDATADLNLEGEHDTGFANGADGIQEKVATGASAADRPNVSVDFLPKKKKKSKGKGKASSSNDINTLGTSLAAAPTGAPSHPPPDNSLFPLPNYMPYPPYYPGTQPNMPAFPSLNNLTFPDLTLGSNEDVLRALQGLDLSNITGVLKTLSDAADAANIQLATLPSSRTPVPAVASGSLPRASEDGQSFDTTLAAPASEPQTRSGHADLLATKWMGPTKLAELVKSEGLVYKKGKFSAIEVKQVNEAIEKYRTARGLSEAALNQIIWPSDEKQKDATFWTEITSAVSLRPIISVYHYVRRSHHPLKQQGKWLPDEDAKLIQAVTSLGQQWEKVAGLVGRMATDCRDRYRNHIVDREKRVTGAWSPDEEEELTRIVIEVQKGKDLDNEVFWGKVSDLMGGKRSRQQCRIKWTDSLSKRYKTDGQNPRWSSRDAFILIHKIDLLNIQDDSEIPWKSIPDPQWNLWSPHTLQRRWLTMKRGIKGYEDMTHREIMDILRVKNADVPHVKSIKSAKFVVDSDDDTPRPGSSTGPGTLGTEGGNEEDDSV